MKRLTILFLALISLISMVIPGFASESFLYTDNTSGCSIPVPTNWKLEYLDNGVSFVPRSGESVPMSYHFTDVWNTLSLSEQKNCSRDLYGNDQIAKADIADLLDVRSKDVKQVNLAGNEYFQVTAVTTKGFFIFKSKSTVISLIHVHNGYLHLFQFEDDASNPLYPTFESMIAGTCYCVSANTETETAVIEPPVPSPTLADNSKPKETIPSDADIYQDAQEAYDDGDYSAARKLFESVSSYSDSQKYLRLIRIRGYGSNSGIGCVYNFNKALTDSQKKEIDQAAEDFYFADTTQVLLCNTDVACYYLGAHNSLSGNWITASNAPTYAYFKLHKDASGGYYYTRSSNLSNAVSDCVSIIDGDVRISITSSNTLVFHIDLTAPDCMDIYSYETCKSFALYRS